MTRILSVFSLSLIACLGTGLGGLIAVLCKPSPQIFGFLMGVTAEVMISLSFIDLVNEAWRYSGYLIATLSFGIGALFMVLIDVSMPHLPQEK